MNAAAISGTHRIAAYFNRNTGQWVARCIKKTLIEPFLPSYRRECLYGYGGTAEAAVSEVRTQIGTGRVLIRIRQPK